MLEGILSTLSDTNYEGHKGPVNINDLFHKGELSPEELKAVDFASKLPRIFIKKEEIYKWAKAKKNSISQRQRAMQAFEKICRTNILVYYERAKFDKNGTPLRDTRGNIQKEPIVYEDRLFKLGKNLQDGSLEITPSLVFLDQIEKYFILLPKNWREEILSVTNQKRLPKGLEQFILALRTHYEIRRRKSESTKLIWSAEQICSNLSIPLSYISKKQKHLKERLEKICYLAKESGYIKSYEIDDSFKTTIDLEESKYYNPSKRNFQKENPQISDKAETVFNIFYQTLKNRGIRKQTPTGSSRLSSIDIFQSLLNQGYQPDVISKIINWGINSPFWASKILTPASFRKNFDSMLIEMKNQKNSSCVSKKEHCGSKTRLTLSAIPKKDLDDKGISFKIWPTSVEFFQRNKRSLEVMFDDKFDESFEKALKKLFIF